jgi:hypothetical protein
MANRRGMGRGGLIFRRFGAADLQLSSMPSSTHLPFVSAATER